MSIRSHKTSFLFAAPLATLAGLLAATLWLGCSSNSDDGDDAAGGAPATDAGGSTSTDGAGGNGDSGATATGQGGSTADPCAPCQGEAPTSCTPTVPIGADVTDFSGIAEGGVFLSDSNPETQWNNLYGGTYVYPALDACLDTQPAYPLTTDVTGGNWHITGTAGTWSGFGLWFGPCSVLDLTGYSGIAFTISSAETLPGPLTMSINSASNSAPSADAANPTCITNSATCTAENCAASTLVLDTVGGTPTEVTVSFADMIDGAPSVTPVVSEITGIQWMLHWEWTSDDSYPPYPVDITIDDIRLVP